MEYEAGTTSISLVSSSLCNISPVADAGNHGTVYCRYVKPIQELSNKELAAPTMYHHPTPSRGKTAMTAGGHGHVVSSERHSRPGPEWRTPSERTVLFRLLP